MKGNGIEIKEYRIAMYLRVSKTEQIPSAQPTVCSHAAQSDRVETSGKESNSIGTQRGLLRKYVAKNFAEYETGYELEEFCDDGYTGTNWQRPGMQTMLEKARRGDIQCILVKDFSRFARDYIEMGVYLEQIFPFLGVRFISVNDGYDSDNFKGSLAGMDVNFKNLLYDFYSKDLSGKVRSSLAVRKEKGQYVSANAPFGYEKAPGDRHALVVAGDEAEIVRRIFLLTTEGYTSVEIARIFNEARVKTPIEFKIEKGKTSRIPKGERFTWNASTICQILRNGIYIGNIVQKKYTKDFVGGKNHLNPREEWLVTCNHHEPIINKEVFEKVQKGRGKKPTPQYQPAHPLVGMLVCGCCKNNLRYRKGLNPYFSCPQRYSNGMKHCVDKVNALFMEEYVLWMLQDKLQAAGAAEKSDRRHIAVDSGREYESGSARNLGTVLSKEMIENYIDRIEVYDERRIEICWKTFLTKRHI
ncbi:MAG: recombinase family protein [Blautia sp.]|nr:recombinase family protein [Blautia sp.]